MAETLVRTVDRVRPAVTTDVPRQPHKKKPALNVVEVPFRETYVDEAQLIQTSPYSDTAHLLDLNTLEPSHRLLPISLTELQPIRNDYASAPYESSFNWSDIVNSYRALASEFNVALPDEIAFDVIVFRSKLKPGADRSKLGELDKLAHREAVQSGGLLKYWFGKPDAKGRNLATCVWRSRQDARAGGTGPGHAASMRAARAMYDEWHVERLNFVINSKKGSWRFEIVS